MYREVSNLYRAVIIKHANPSGVPSGSKFEPRPADYRCLRDVVNLTGDEFDIPRLREHFAEDLQWKPFVGDNKEYFIWLFSQWTNSLKTLWIYPIIFN